MSGSARPHQVVAALVRELVEDAPTVVVLEDMHWADGATLDALRLLGRRIDAVPALVVVSYRDDELDRMHPLRMVLGELGRRRGQADADRAAVAARRSPSLPTRTVSTGRRSTG